MINFLIHLQMPIRYYLLLNAVQGSKDEMPSALVGFLSHRTTVVVTRGGLLIDEAQPGPFKYRLHSDSRVSIHDAGTNVAPLDLIGFQMIEAIQDLETRISVYQKGQLAFGRNVHIGSRVAMTASEAISGYAIAVVRYKGPVGNKPGLMFGVELEVRYS